MAVTRPPFITQRDGSRCQFDNCGLTATCMAIWRHLEGLNPEKISGAPWPPTPKYLRNIFSPTTCGGTRITPNDTFLASEYYGVQFETRLGLPWDDFDTLIRSGRGAVVRIMYAPLHGTIYDHSSKFNGSHAVYVNEVRSDGYFLVGDPLASDFAWWPEDLLQRASEAASLPGLLDANFTRDTEGLMIPITVEVPKLLTAAVGKQIYYTDGTKFRTVKTKIVDRLSPFGTKVAGVDYRVVRAGSDGQHYLFMMKTTDVSLKNITIT